MLKALDRFTSGLVGRLSAVSDMLVTLSYWPHHQKNYRS